MSTGGWVSGRHQQLSLQKVDNLERSRAESLSEDVVKQHFELLGGIMEEYQLQNAPRQIYNCDETFVPINFTREKAVVLKRSKTTYMQSHGTSEHITTLCTASAAGLSLPPMIIYSKSFPGGQYWFEGPDNVLYAKSESG